jgi:tetratricopeptide (TPR) repeat protein/ketosteroid isomerase-like protein
MNKKLLLIILSLIFLFSAPSIFAEAVNTSQQTIADIPAGTAEEYYNRGNAYKKQGNLTQAIANYTNVIRINSKNAKAYYNRGNAYGKQGNLTQAIADYTSVIEIDSKYAAAYCNRGNAYQTQGNFQQAIADYNKAIEINPDIAGFYSNRGKAYQSQDNLHQAIVDYNKALELNPKDNATYYNRGLSYYGIEQYGSSLADYKNATSKNPNKEAYDDFIKYVPVKNTSDTGNVRNEILQLFEEKLNLDKNTAMQKSASIVAAAPVPVVSTPAPAVVAAPVVTSANKDLAQISTKQNETKSIPEQDVQNVVLKWAASWESGDMKTYGSFYASNFQSKGMTLNQWISYKTNVHQKSKNITIRIDDLQISAEGNSATAVFTQSYSSSILKDKGKKTLELRKTNNEWKIYKEIM